MSKMSFKNDIEMWHKFADFAEHLKFVAHAQEQKLYSQCVFYSYDDAAFEEYCNNEKIIRRIDFEACNECWKCPFYATKK
jgi:hypothetical protein